MIKTPQSLIRVAVFCLPLVLTASCGESTTQNNVVTVTPVTLGVTSSPPPAVPTAANPTFAAIVQTYRIETRSPTGNAQIGTEMIVHSAGTLYEGAVAVTCTATAPTTPPTCVAAGSLPLQLPYRATTNSTGTFEVTMVLIFGRGSDGTQTVVEAFSGTGYGKTDVVFACVDGATACP